MKPLPEKKELVKAANARLKVVKDYLPVLFGAMEMLDNSSPTPNVKAIEQLKSDAKDLTDRCADVIKILGATK